MHIEDITKEDIGKWAIFTYNHELNTKTKYIKRGKIKSFNDKFIFVVFYCDDNWHKYYDYTAEACYPENLEME